MPEMTALERDQAEHQAALERLKIAPPPPVSSQAPSSRTQRNTHAWALDWRHGYYHPNSPPNTNLLGEEKKWFLEGIKDGFKALSLVEPEKAEGATAKMAVSV